MTLPEAALAVSRFAHYLALAVLFGAALFPAYALRGAADGFAPTLRLIRRSMWMLAALALLSGLAWLLFSVAVMSGDLAGAADPSAISTVVTGMDFGRVWAVRLLGLVALFALAVLGRQGLVAALGGLLLASIALTGHAFAEEGWRRWAHAGADAAHLLAAGAWIGGLVPLAVIARARPGRFDGAGDGAGLAQVLSRFSGVGYAAVATLVATGLVNAWFLVGEPQRLLTTPYGQLLTLKLALFAAMLCLAAVNRFRVTPAIARGEGAVWLTRLRRHVLAEQALAAGVLLAVAFLGTLAPASA